MILGTDKIPFKLAILGASGFAREVADIALERQCSDLAYLVPDPEEEVYFGYKLLPEKDIFRLQQQGFLFAVGVGDNRIRKKIATKYAQLSFPNIIHPSATMGQDTISQFERVRGNIVTAGVRFTNNITFGDFGIYNLNCTVGHDCLLKDFINLAPGVNLSGNVCLEEGVYIGTNASVLQGKSIDRQLVLREYATIGAGAVVTKEIPSHSTAVGVPARVKSDAR